MTTRTKQRKPSGSSPLADRLLAWFDRHGRRHLPWQKSITPYRVWVSEIMLQQTQVTTVIPYFERFMQRFPDVHSLAAATEDEVLHLWTGLGYYSRARNLLRAARRVTQEHNGIFPTSADELETLPGIGPSTAGAIASIACGQRAPILDGNVKRVLARHHAIEGWPGTTAVNRQLWQLAEHHTPHERVPDYTQAIMDLGATLCTRSKPRCDDCPLTSTCLAHAQGRVSEFPGKRPKTEKPLVSTVFLIVQAPDSEILLRRRDNQGVWQGLWSFPELNALGEADDWCLNTLGQAPESKTTLPSIRHSFSHYHLEIQPLVASMPRRPGGIADQDGLRWVDPSQPGTLGLAAPVARLLDKLGHSSLTD